MTLTSVVGRAAGYGATALNATRPYFDLVFPRRVLKVLERVEKDLTELEAKVTGQETDGS